MKSILKNTACIFHYISPRLAHTAPPSHLSFRKRPILVFPHLNIPKQQKTCKFWKLIYIGEVVRKSKQWLTTSILVSCSAKCRTGTSGSLYTFHPTAAARRAKAGGGVSNGSAWASLLYLSNLCCTLACNSVAGKNSSQKWSKWLRAVWFGGSLKSSG